MKRRHILEYAAPSGSGRQITATFNTKRELLHFISGLLAQYPHKDITFRTWNEIK